MASGYLPPGMLCGRMVYALLLADTKGQEASMNLQYTPQENALMLASILGVDPATLHSVVLVAEYTDTESGNLSMRIERIGQEEETSYQQEDNPVCRMLLTADILTTALHQMLLGAHDANHGSHPDYQHYEQPMEGMTLDDALDEIRKDGEQEQ